jgi:hypothetical protein
MLLQVPTYLKPFLTNIAKGGIGAVLVVSVWGYTSWRGENRLDYQYQLEKMERREATYLRTIQQQAGELKDLQDGFYILSSSRRQSPLPEWSKGVGGHYMWRNQAFDDWFLIPNGVSPDSILFRTDEEIWKNPDLAKTYRNNDLQVMRENRVIHSVEYIPVGSEVITWHSWKYPLKNGQYETIGVGGIAVSSNKFCL